MRKPLRLVGAATVAVILLIPAGGWSTHPGTRITGTVVNAYAPGDSGGGMKLIQLEPLYYVWSLGCNQGPVRDVMVKNSGETAVGVSIVEILEHQGEHARFRADGPNVLVWFWREGGTVGIGVPCSTVLDFDTGGTVNQWRELIIPSNARWISVRRYSVLPGVVNQSPSVSWELYVCPVSPPTSTHPCTP